MQEIAPHTQYTRSDSVTGAVTEGLARGLLPHPKGKGLNSIPMRFALMTGVMTAAGLAGNHMLLNGDESGISRAVLLVVGAITVVLTSSITWFAGSKLASAIEALRKSTEAIVAGDLSSPVDVDCACEVGGLADSFRAMIARFNSNIVRMNVLAYSDPVTGLANRAVITHVLGTVATNDRCMGTLLFIDLDNFKKINDTLGHKAGDELLRMVSERIIVDGFGLSRNDIDDCTSAFGELCLSCPDKPVFARFAGDEFVALFPGMEDRAEIEARARAVIKAVAEPFDLDGTEVRISASVGIARMPIDTNDPDQVLQFADLAMYAAKESGRNRFHFFDHSLRELAIDRDQIEKDLRRAIETEALSLHYQPKVDVATMRVAGVEALVRWQHPERGNIPPDEFIGLAEQRGLMPDLGRAVMRMAIRQARIWQEQRMPMPVAINVSAAQFEDPALVGSILAELGRHDLDPSMIEIEITETMVMSDFARTHDRIRRLREAGVHISIDDFGTGFSNLSQLSRLPFSVLKVDKSLIADIGRNPKSEAIIKAIVQMAHALGHKVVAEGIEQVQQFSFIGRLGCDLAQGHLFSAAMPEQNLPEWIAAQGRSDARALLELAQQRLAAG